MDPCAERLAAARVYLVCDAQRPDDDLSTLLEAALEGGVDLIQLRDKDATIDRLLAAARIFRTAADRHGALFLLNDRPDLVAECRADGVHVGQDDTPVRHAREQIGPEAVIGLSTHTPAQLEAAERAAGAARPDYLSVGPVWATPTKPGRPAAGLDYVRHAATEATLPWFAIGGIDPGNVGEVREAGGSRIVVVRAIAGADEPGRVAAELRSAIGAVPAGTSR